MSQIMVEAFARSLIHKIMVDAFYVMHSNDEKLQILDNREESADVQSQTARVMLQIEDRSCANYNEPGTTELIENMVRHLRNLQIGDSTSVPPHLTILEKQVKHAACNIDNVSLAASPELTETHTIQGQGDVHQVIHNAIIETASDSTDTHLEKETNSLSEATRVSIHLLHRMIEELERRTEETDEKKEIEFDAVNKEKITTWEETEERFIRTIENVDDLEQSNINPISESNSRNDICDLACKGSTSSSLVDSTILTKNTCLEEVVIDEITPSPFPDQEIDYSSNVTLNKMKRISENNAETEETSKKKKSILSRTRKLFRAIFGHRKK
ncbi:hypothetical protein ANTRET_LOCUS2370 [Anthophora retusa]